MSSLLLRLSSLLYPVGNHVFFTPQEVYVILTTVHSLEDGEGRSEREK